MSVSDGLLYAKWIRNILSERLFYKVGESDFRGKTWNMWAGWNF